MMTLSILTVLYGFSAVFGILFLFYMFKILSELRMIGEHPRSWMLLGTGMAMIATSSLIELVFVSDPRNLVFNTFNLYFAVGNLLVFQVLLTVWRDLGG